MIHRINKASAESHCKLCGQPSDEDISALVIEFRRYYPQWSSIRCFDRAYIAAAKGAKPQRLAP